MYFHWQNLNERAGGACGPGWRHGRAWLGRWRVEWVIPSLGFGCMLHRSHEGWCLALKPFLFSLYVGRGEGAFFGAQHGFDWDGESKTFRVCLITRDDGSHRSADPWWLKPISFCLPDIFLGRRSYSECDIETADVLVPMPEGCYPAKARLFESTWKRPRWSARRLMRVEIEMEKGIPFEGKGEDSWNCGEDATYSITCHARNIEEGIGVLVGSVLRDRRRYGGRLTHGNLAPALSPRA